MVHARDDDGQALPLGLAIAGLAVALAVGLATLVGHVIDAGRARTAADAAALAGVSGGPGAAARLADANDAAVVAFARSGETVTVTVRVGDVEATARASSADVP